MVYSRFVPHSLTPYAVDCEFVSHNGQRKTVTSDFFALGVDEVWASLGRAIAPGGTPLRTEPSSRVFFVSGDVTFTADELVDYADDIVHGELAAGYRWAGSEWQMSNDRCTEEDGTETVALPPTSDEIKPLDVRVVEPRRQA